MPELNASCALAIGRSAAWFVERHTEQWRLAQALTSEIHTMKVTIVGGWSKKNSEGHKDWKLKINDHEAIRTFTGACSLIGRALARKGHFVVVGSDSDRSADYHVVQGFISELAGRKVSDPPIHVIQGIVPGQVPYNVERRSEERGALFRGVDSNFSGQKPRAAEKILAVRDADALIAVGGLGDTYVAGVAALVAGKPVVPVATFGGAARQLLDTIRMVGDGGRGEDLGRLADEVWSPDLVDAALRFGGLDRPGVFLGSSGRAEATATEIRDFVSSLGFRVVYWKTDFRRGYSILDELRAASYSCKYAILLLTPDDRIAGDDPRWVPRDNVIFEAGYFINALGPRRTAVVVQRGVHVLADYAGHIYYDLLTKSNDPAVADVSSIKDGLRKFLSQDIPGEANPESNTAPA